MSDEQDPDADKPSIPGLTLSDSELDFIKAEGLDMLTAFRAIRDRHKRDLVLELARAIVEAQPKVDGH